MAEAHAALAHILMHRWRWAEAEREHRVALGDHERAIDWLEREVASGSNMTMGVRADTRLAPLRTHPRYARLLRRLGVD